MRVTAIYVLLFVVMAAGFVSHVRASSALWNVSQRHRAFNPTHLDITKGGTIEILNDDGELIHHAYVKSDTFNFDSGEQAPGSKLDIVFTKEGQFTILCGIHPRMHLEVTVK